MSDKQQIELSILICSLHSRKKLLDKLENILQPQLDKYANEVESVVLTDNGQMKIGAKRNHLIKVCRGEYVTFVDDDDLVSDNYCEKLLEKIKFSPDVIVFDAERWENGRFDRNVKYGIEYLRDSNTRNCYYRIPNHLMCIKKSIAEKYPFKEINFGEDADFAKRILPELKKQERINETLYKYLYVNK